MVYGDLTAQENLEFFASLYGVTGAAARERIDELLRLVELDHRRNDCARTFSRGMQQRLSIARALVNDPEIVLLDEPYSGLDPHAAELFDGLIGRVREGRTFAMVSHDLEKLEFFASLYGVTGAAARERIDELLRLVELDHRRNDCARTFSRGMQQRLSIARALVTDPEIVLLDEPYSGLDPHAAELFDGLIGRVRGGRTFAMVSHDLEKGYDLCTHALILAQGKVVVCARKDDVDRAAFRDLYLATVGMGVA